MNTKAVTTVADVICRAQKNGTLTPAGLAIALDSAQLLQSPETAAELEKLRARVAELEAERRSTNAALAEQTVACRAAEAELRESLKAHAARETDPARRTAWRMLLRAERPDHEAPPEQRLDCGHGSSETCQDCNRCPCACRCNRPSDEDPIAYTLTPEAAAAAERLSALLAPSEDGVQ